MFEQWDTGLVTRLEDSMRAVRIRDKKGGYERNMSGAGVVTG